MDPKRFDVMLTDVSEAGIEAIESLFQERNLRDGKFPETAFPAEGIIFGPNKIRIFMKSSTKQYLVDIQRLIIDLVCQHVKHKLVPKHVFFVVDTASPVTFLSRKSIEALVEPNELFPNSLSVFVQSLNSAVKRKQPAPLCSAHAVVPVVTVECTRDQSYAIGCYLSSRHFSDANILGMNALEKLGLSIDINAMNCTFRLTRRNF